MVFREVLSNINSLTQSLIFDLIILGKRLKRVIILKKIKIAFSWNFNELIQLEIFVYQL